MSAYNYSVTMKGYTSCMYVLINIYSIKHAFSMLLSTLYIRDSLIIEKQLQSFPPNSLKNTWYWSVSNKITNSCASYKFIRFQIGVNRRTSEFFFFHCLYMQEVEVCLVGELCKGSEQQRKCRMQEMDDDMILPWISGLVVLECDLRKCMRKNGRKWTVGKQIKCYISGETWNIIYLSFFVGNHGIVYLLSLSPQSKMTHNMR